MKKMNNEAPVSLASLSFQKSKHIAIADILCDLNSLKSILNALLFFHCSLIKAFKYHVTEILQFDWNASISSRQMVDARVVRSFPSPIHIKEGKGQRHQTRD